MVEKTNKTKRNSNKGEKNKTKKGSNKTTKKGSNKVINKTTKKGSNKTTKINRNLSRADYIANPNLLPKYLQDVITIPLIEKSIFDSEADIKFSETINYPKNSIGFQHYIHAMKNDAQKELETYTNKKKVYEVLNPFELSIDNYTDSISEKGKKYFENINQLNNDFCKLWEMFFMFDLIDLESDLFSCHLGKKDDAKGFAESTDFYKKLFGKSKNDKQYNSDDKITDKLNFITANYSTDIFLNTEEQKFFKDIINYILFTIKNQKKDGTFVLKLTETYTNVSQKIITMISSLYKRVYLCKPLTSKPSDAEKFIVAQGFLYSDSDQKLKNIQSNMEKIKNKIETNNTEIYDIFTDYIIDPEMKVRLTQFNNQIENKQFKAIGQILSFVSAQNFYGDIYQKSREEQIEAAKFWTELFLMPNAEYKQNKAKINDMSYLSNKINLEASLELKKKLIY